HVVNLVEDRERRRVTPAKRRLPGEEQNPRKEHPREHRPLNDVEDDQQHAFNREYDRHQPRLPKIARPTRTIVDPSSIAISKSSLIPIDSSRTPSASRIVRNSRKNGRTASAPTAGGIAISPRTSTPSSATIFFTVASTSSGAIPLFCGSLPMLTCTSSSWRFPAAVAAFAIFSASSSESTLSMT